MFVALLASSNFTPSPLLPSKVDLQNENVK